MLALHTIDRSWLITVIKDADPTSTVAKVSLINFSVIHDSDKFISEKPVVLEVTLAARCVRALIPLDSIARKDIALARFPLGCDAKHKRAVLGIEQSVADEVVACRGNRYDRETSVANGIVEDPAVGGAEFQPHPIRICVLHYIAVEKHTVISVVHVDAGTIIVVDQDVMHG